jgi:hypothetical protein
MQPYSTRFFGCTLPFSHKPQRRWDQQFSDMPETDIRELRWATLRSRGEYRKPIQDANHGKSSDTSRPAESHAKTHHTFDLLEQLSLPSYASSYARYGGST